MADQQRPLTGKLVQILKIEDEGFHIDIEALKGILLKEEYKNQKVAIISIQGSFRTGKSFLMNFFLRYLRNEGWRNANWFGEPDMLVNDGFQWKGGRRSVTSGILMWDEAFTIEKSNGKKVLLFLMDTQGLHDHKNKFSDVELSALCMLMSYIQITNFRGRLDTRDMDFLQMSLDVAMATWLKSGRMEVKLPKLVFLIRDWCMDDDMPFGNGGGAEYLRELTSVPNDLQCFSKAREVECFLMPHPGLRAIASPINTVKNKDLEYDFWEHVRSFVSGLLERNLIFAEGDSELMTVEELFELTVLTDRSLTQFPDAHLSLKGILKESYTEMIKKISDLYREGVENPLIESGKMAKSVAMKLFDSTMRMGSPGIRRKNRQTSEKACQDQYDMTKQAADETARTKLYLWMLQSVTNGKKQLQKEIKQGLVYPGNLHGKIADLEKTILEQAKETFPDYPELVFNSCIVDLSAAMEDLELTMETKEMQYMELGAVGKSPFRAVMDALNKQFLSMETTLKRIVSEPASISHFASLHGAQDVVRDDDTEISHVFAEPQDDAGRILMERIDGEIRGNKRDVSFVDEISALCNEAPSYTIKALADSYFDNKEDFYAAALYKCGWEKMLSGNEDDTATKVIHEGGGVISVRGCEIYFPAGAVEKPVEIKIAVKTDHLDFEKGLFPITPVLELTPCMTLLKPASVKLETWCSKSPSGFGHLYYKRCGKSSWDHESTVALGLDGDMCIEFDIDKFCRYCTTLRWDEIRSAEVLVCLRLYYNAERSMAHHVVCGCKTGEKMLMMRMQGAEFRHACGVFPEMKVMMDDLIKVTLIFTSPTPLPSRLVIEIPIDDNFLREQNTAQSHLLRKEVKEVDFVHVIEHFRQGYVVQREEHSDRVNFSRHSNPTVNVANIMASNQSTVRVEGGPTLEARGAVGDDRRLQ